MEAMREQARRLRARRRHGRARPGRRRARDRRRAPRPELGDGWESRAAADRDRRRGGSALRAASARFIVRAEPRNAIGWIFLSSGALLAASRRGVQLRRRRRHPRRVAARRRLGGVARRLVVHPARVRRAGDRRADLPGRPAAPGPLALAAVDHGRAIAVESVLAARSTRRARPYRRARTRSGFRHGVGTRRGALNDAGGAVLAPRRLPRLAGRARRPLPPLPRRRAPADEVARVRRRRARSPRSRSRSC